MDHLIGRSLGQYRLIEVIGAGARGTVFRAEQIVLRQPRAIKIPKPQLTAEPGFVERFLREARLVAALRHPNIVQVYDADVWAEYHYLAMELLTGTTLAEIVRAERALPIQRAIELLRQVAAALDYAHRDDPDGRKPRVIHRDVKPENIMVEPNDHVTLVDFGIARAAEGTALTGAGGLVGSAAYMAPEVILGGDPDPSADRYSLGVVAYELLTGRVPFAGSSVVAIMDAHVNQPPPAPRSIQPSLTPAAEAVLLRQLAKDPAERYPSGAAFVGALNAALSGEVTAEWGAPAAAPAPPPADPIGRASSDTPTEELPPPTTEPTRPVAGDPTRSIGDTARATAAGRRTPTHPRPRPVPPPPRAIVRADARRPAPGGGFTPARRPWLLYGLIAAAFLLAFVGLALLWPLIGGTNRSRPPAATPSVTAALADNSAAAAAGTPTATPTVSPSPTERPILVASPSPPTPGPTPSPTSGPTATPTPPPPTATPAPAAPPRFGLRIDAPANRAQVPREIAVRGVQTAPRPPGTHLWLFVSAQVPDSRWYSCPRGELVAGPDLAWSCDLYLGGPPGTRHTIVLGLVDDRATTDLARYIAANPDQPIFPDTPTAALPPGFSEQASIEVSVQ